MPISTEARQRWVLLALIAVHVFLPARQPRVERAGRRPLLGNRARNDRDRQLGRAAFLVSAAPRQTADDLLARGGFDETVRPERMGGAPAAGAGGHQRCVGGVVHGLFHRRSPRRLVERADSAKLAALLRHGANVDAGHFPDAIHRVGNVFFLAKLAFPKFAIRNSQFAIFSVASGRLGCNRARFFDQRPDCRGHSAHCAGGAGHLPPEKFFPMETSARRSGWRTWRCFWFWCCRGFWRFFSRCRKRFITWFLARLPDICSAQRSKTATAISFISSEFSPSDFCHGHGCSAGCGAGRTGAVWM